METATDNGSIADSVLSDTVLEGLKRDTALARGLPNEAFTTEAFLALEYQHAFARTWVFAGRAGSVANRGDIEPVQVAGRSLFMLRGTDDEVRVFHNVCPHRGARLVVESMRGAPALTYPYHAWSYELDGTLKGRPHYHGPDQHDRGNNGGNDRVCLFEARSVTWNDWVFVNLDGEAPPLEEYIATVTDHFSHWDISQFRYAHYDAFEFRCNWKLAVENFCDTYHVFKVHQELDRAYVPEQRATAQPDGIHMFMFNMLAGPGRGLTFDAKGPELPPLPGVPDELARAQPSCNLFPNVTIAISPGNLQFVMFEAVGPDRCVMHMWFYFVGDAAESAEHEQARKMVYAEWAHINAEDEGICRRLQEGRSCDAYDGGRLAPYWDVGTAHFHRHLADAILAKGAFERG